MSIEQIQTIRQNFVTLNQQRLQRTLELMRAKQADIIGVLAHLFHVNQQKLPGFAGNETPSGIANYNSSEETLKLVQKTFGRIEHDRRVQVKNDIEALYIMGSCGSLAFSKDSDFDIWLCHSPELNATQLQKLQQKATGIEQWAAEKGLEVHFFLMNADNFRNGNVAELSSESSGSTQHQLLLDEFYRTSVWLAGKYPRWWFVPVEQEANYDSYSQQLIDNGFLHSDEVIDFGGVPAIPEKEFFGASVWQIYKSIDSPYKSILKITLMEAYANAGKALISHQLKHAVHEGNNDAEQLDPYAMLLNYLENYLQKRDEPLRLELIRRSFYLKLHLPLSGDTHKENWRHTQTRSLTDRWGWNDTQISLLDHREDWSVFEVMDERKLLVEHLTKSYLFLSDRARQNNSDNLINSRDLTILGRKLYAALEKRPGKLEIFSRGISKSISEECVTIILGYNKSGEARWLLYRGKMSPSEVQHYVPVKQCSSLVELLSWCHVNQIITNSSQILAYAQATGLTSSDLKQTLDHLRQVIPSPDKLNTESKDFLRPAHITQGILFINANIPPSAIFSGNIKGVINGTTDVLHYGHDDETLITSLDFVHTNSWGEVHVNSYSGTEGLALWICDYLNWAKLNQQQQQTMFDVPLFCQTPHIGQRIQGSIQELFDFINKAFLPNRVLDTNNRLIFEAAKRYYLIDFENDKAQHQTLRGSPEIIAALYHEKDQPQKIWLEKNSLRPTLLRPMFDNFEAQRIEVFYYVSGDQGIIYTLDDTGCLHAHRLKANLLKTQLLHYYAFLRSYLIQTRFSGRDQPEALNQFRTTQHELLAFFHLKKEPIGYVAKQQDNLALAGLGRETLLKALGSMRNGRKVFSFECNGKLFSSAEHGNNLFLHVAQYCAQQNVLPIISCLELDHALVGLNADKRIPLHHFIKYRRVLEDKLRLAVQKIA
ncbi:MAG: class I adenylate cyclase [Gammaproteobacteria bacterium]|nr:class I adenylate cyclase [Gammaproteobacteria bacterium]